MFNIKTGGSTNIHGHDTEKIGFAKGKWKSTAIFCGWNFGWDLSITSRSACWNQQEKSDLWPSTTPLPKVGNAPISRQWLRFGKDQDVRHIGYHKWPDHFRHHPSWNSTSLTCIHIHVQSISRIWGTSPVPRASSHLRGAPTGSESFGKIEMDYQKRLIWYKLI